MMKRLCLAALGLVWLNACVVVPPRAHVSGPEVVIGVPPPAPYAEVVPPSPGYGYIWAPGYWRWDGRRHVWVHGYWTPSRARERWTPHHWEADHRGRWHLRGGHWSRH